MKYRLKTKIKLTNLGETHHKKESMEIKTKINKTNQTYKLLHSKGNHKQNEKTT